MRTRPNAGEELWIVEGVNPIVIANDVVRQGHWTYYPSDKETVALQVPFSDGLVPEHRVVKKGACLPAAEGGMDDASGREEDNLQRVLGL